MHNLGKFHIGALTTVLKNPAPSERLPFKKALRCTQSLVDFQLVAQYLSHTETVLAYMASYPDLFLEFRTSKVGNAKACEVNQVLRQYLGKDAAALEGLPPLKKRNQAVENKLARDEEIQHPIRNKSHFNFINMHLLTQFVECIRRIGNIPMWSTEIGESSHKGIIKLRSGLTGTAIDAIWQADPPYSRVMEAPIIYIQQTNPRPLRPKVCYGNVDSSDSPRALE